MICFQELLGFLVYRIICCKEVYKCEVFLADAAAEFRAEFLARPVRRTQEHDIHSQISRLIDDVGRIRTIARQQDTLDSRLLDRFQRLCKIFLPRLICFIRCDSIFIFCFRFDPVNESRRHGHRNIIVVWYQNTGCRFLLLFQHILGKQISLVGIYIAHAEIIRIILSDQRVIVSDRDSRDLSIVDRFACDHGVHAPIASQYDIRLLGDQVIDRRLGRIDIRGIIAVDQFHDLASYIRVYFMCQFDPFDLSLGSIAVRTRHRFINPDLYGNVTALFLLQKSLFKIIKRRAACQHGHR